jgi:hypothetical protein
VHTHVCTQVLMRLGVRLVGKAASDKEKDAAIKEKDEAINERYSASSKYASANKELFK